MISIKKRHNDGDRYVDGQKYGEKETKIKTYMARKMEIQKHT